MQSVRTRGGRVDCLTSGTGRKKVVLMHGNPSDAWVYEQLLLAAPADYQLISINWYGDSDRPWGGYNAHGYADQALDVMNALDIPLATVGGHSLGGLAAEIFALRYPTRVKALILMGTGSDATQHKNIGSMLNRLKSEGHAAIREVVAGSYGSLPKSFDDHIKRALKFPMEPFIEAMSSGQATNLTAMLGYLTMPTLIVHGEADSGRSEYDVETLHHGIRNSEVVILPCGHYMMEELPSEFNAAVLSFLAAHA